MTTPQNIPNPAPTMVPYDQRDERKLALDMWIADGPTGLNENLQRVTRLMADGRERTAADVRENLNISDQTARKYLRLLASYRLVRMRMFDGLRGQSYRAEPS